MENSNIPCVETYVLVNFAVFSKGVGNEEESGCREKFENHHV